MVPLVLSLFPLHSVRIYSSSLVRILHDSVKLLQKCATLMPFIVQKFGIIVQNRVSKCSGFTKYSICKGFLQS